MLENVVPIDKAPRILANRRIEPQEVAQIEPVAMPFAEQSQGHGSHGDGDLDAREPIARIANALQELARSVADLEKADVKAPPPLLGKQFQDEPFMLGVQAHNERTAPSVESGRNDAGHGVVRLAGYVGAKRGALRRSDNFCREGMLLLPLQGNEVITHNPARLCCLPSARTTRFSKADFVEVNRSIASGILENAIANRSLLWWKT